MQLISLWRENGSLYAIKTNKKELENRSKTMFIKEVWLINDTTEVVF